MTDERCPAATRGVDFPRRGADSDKSKEIEMIDERYPAAFLDECREILKDEFPAFLRALALPPRRALRLNPQRNGAEQAAAPFLPDGAPRVPWEPLGRYLAADAKPGAGIAHAAGAFYLQDASAMAPVATLDPRPGERVLDLCAAPGGKSGQIAARLNGRGFLLSNEIEFSRARILLGNLERLGVTNAFVTSAPAEALARALPAFFDRVLVDAPCSGEGMFRRDPEAASQWNPDAPAGCAARQTAILNNAARMVRPGGKLVYSTCTFNRLENEGTVREFLRAHPDFEPDAFELPGVGASRDGCLRLWPHRIEGEGHFLARFTRKGEETCARNVSLPEVRASVESRRVESETFSVRAQINDGAPSEPRATAESGRVEFEPFPVRALPEARATAESGRVESETFPVRAPSEARASAESRHVESETFSVRAQINDGAPSEARATAESGRIESGTFPVRTLPEARASAESGRVESETSSVRAQINDGAPSEARATAKSGRVESETFSVRAPSEARATAESGRVESETFSVRAQINDGALPEVRATAESGRIESETFPVRASKGSGRFESPNARLRTDNSRRASAPKGRAAASRDSCGRGTPKPDLSEFVRALPEGEIVVDGDEVRLVSALAPDPAKLTGVRVLRAGLPLATLGRSHIEPAHALAMALDPETARQTIDLTDEQAASYLSGEVFPVDAPTGWTLAAWRGLPLGWCKITGGTLKNHLPKGLRRRG